MVAASEAPSHVRRGRHRAAALAPHGRGRAQGERGGDTPVGHPAEAAGEPHRLEPRPANGLAVLREHRHAPLDHLAVVVGAVRDALVHQPHHLRHAVVEDVARDVEPAELLRRGGRQVGGVP
eukprot:CAMPEP_0118946332 /NCGR_PEP_ID=MMETSP1169-20130426/44042_1 /TAXON_ID=36882 /ORGANISM="Pyramimonas obovata, Strain CCMP722" /LENGTH=121 /DNA_ID=CAMNT_0006892273 /DNA_START=122 /DNA_END=487 /DNA_ORIENTATION=-